jgi:DNA-binding SARP family transcriptional activator/tetratricopeptide (TPR) repeat protein
MPGINDAGPVSVRLLGPFAVTVGGSPVAMSSRPRTLLAVLALDVGRPVPTERIAAAVWGDGRPADTRKAIQVLVARLRAVLGAGAIRTTADGYQLGVPPDAVDLHRFESALARSRATQDAAEEYHLLQVALRHWDGPPFEAVHSDLLLAVDRPRLLELALHAVERCADIALAGHVPELGDQAARLRELVGAHPLRESLWVRLMAVLDATGRRADALAAYRDLYRVLREELGTQPGEEAQTMQRRLLADGADEPRLATTGPPSTLPPSDTVFGGRADALASLDALLEPGTASHAARIAVVDGPGGIGKTTTVLHWARRVADRFPDGSLYVDLRGFSPTDTPLAPEAAVRRFLDALRVPPGRIPADSDAQAALYRSVLADRRVLVVLDNARSVEQVRPLLPGGRHCAVVATSRNRLGGLVAMEGATRVTLATLTPSEARNVLAARLGTARLAAEPAAANELLALCGGLPLAHVIVAERAAARPGAPLADLVGELHGSRIDALSADDDRAARSVFSWSYRALGADAARVFRLLGLHPGPHVTVPGVACLAALPEHRARTAVAELERASLLTEPAPGRFAMHELLVDYAVELVRGDPPADVESATVRMLDHYLCAAHQAEETLAPMEDPHTVDPPPDGVPGPPPADYNSGVEVFESETPVFVAMVRRAAGTGHDEHTWRIARCLRTYLWGRGLVSTAFEVERLALAALESLGRVPEQVASRCWIVHALMRFGRFDDAWQTIVPTLAIAERFASDGVHAWAQHAMGVVLAERGRPDEALVHARRALELFRRAGDRVGEGRVEPAAAFYLRLLGRHADALDAAQRAFAIETETGDLLVRGHTHELIGDIQRERGEHRAAVESFRAAVDDRRPIGRDASLADVLDKLGDAYEAAGDPDRASTARRDARSVRDELAPAPVAR